MNYHNTIGKQTIQIFYIKFTKDLNRCFTEERKIHGWQMSIKWCSTSIVVENEIKTTRYCHIANHEWLKWKQMTILPVCRMWRNRDSHTTSPNVKWYLWETSSFIKGLMKASFIGCSHSTPKYLPQRNESFYLHKGTVLKTFWDALPRL